MRNKSKNYNFSSRLQHVPIDQREIWECLDCDFKGHYTHYKRHRAKMHPPDPNNPHKPRPRKQNTDRKAIIEAYLNNTEVKVAKRKFKKHETVVCEFCAKSLKQNSLKSHVS